MRLLPLLCLAAVLSAADSPAFATWIGDPCTTLTVRVVAQAAPGTLVFTPVAGGEARSVAAVIRPVGGTGWSVAEATATGLPADSGWVVSVPAGAQLGRYRTLPAAPPLRIAVGGDLMHKVEWLAATCAVAAAEKPRLALVGGDWAYDNAVEKDFARWVDLLRTWQEKMVTADGWGIPVVAGIGNHELQNKGEKDLLKTPFHAIFPEPTNRAFDIGGWFSLLLLDTGHAQRIEDQTAWLQDALAARSGRTWRFAMYHVPGYPSVRKFEDVPSAKVREQWVPLFERMGVAAGFENHDHALKRTHPLLGGKSDPAGITYIGDGSWGVEPRKPDATRPYLAVAKAVHHVWILDLDAASCAARALGPDGAELDRTAFKPR